MRVIGGMLAALLLFSTANATEYYRVQVTRKSDNLYEVVGQRIFVMTRYCYEYVYYEDAILKIDSPYGYSVGEIIFVNSSGSKCDIEKLLK